MSTLITLPLLTVITLTLLYTRNSSALRILSSSLSPLCIMNLYSYVMFIILYVSVQYID